MGTVTSAELAKMLGVPVHEVDAAVQTMRGTNGRWSTSIEVHGDVVTTRQAYGRRRPAPAVAPVVASVRRGESAVWPWIRMALALAIPGVARALSVGEFVSATSKPRVLR